MSKHTHDLYAEYAREQYRDHLSLAAQTPIAQQPSAQAHVPSEWYADVASSPAQSATVTRNNSCLSGEKVAERTNGCVPVTRQDSYGRSKFLFGQSISQEFETASTQFNIDLEGRNGKDHAESSFLASLRGPLKEETNMFSQVGRISEDANVLLPKLFSGDDDEEEAN